MGTKTKVFHCAKTAYPLSVQSSSEESGEAPVEPGLEAGYSHDSDSSFAREN